SVRAREDATRFALAAIEIARQDAEDVLHTRPTNPLVTGTRRPANAAATCIAFASSRSASGRRQSPSIVDTATPSRYAIRFDGMARTRSPVVRMPVRFSGSAA